MIYSNNCKKPTDLFCYLDKNYILVIILKKHLGKNYNLLTIAKKKLRKIKVIHLGKNTKFIFVFWECIPN